MMMRFEGNDLLCYRHQDHTMGWSQITELSYNWTSEYEYEVFNSLYLSNMI